MCRCFDLARILFCLDLLAIQSTTGALLLARTPQAARDLSQQFRARTVHKTYLALVRAGRQSFSAAKGEIDAKLLIEDGRVSVSNQGKEALTGWELVGSSVRPKMELVSS
jgi:23S rRNA-/tRNA-specific pseudouridylate synthase